MKISCVKRDETGTGASNKLRKEDFIPGVVYGKGKEPEIMAISRKDLESILKEMGANAILDMEMNGKTYHVMLKEVQKDRIKGTMLHVDFMQVGKDQKVVVAVAVHLDNTDRLLNEGALVHLLDYVEVECPADHIPKSFHLDVGEMVVGDIKTVSDIDVEQGISILSDPAEPIASLSAFRVEEEPEEGAEEPSEPVLIGEEDTEE